MLDVSCRTEAPVGSTAPDPCGVSREQFICQALKLLPSGPLWSQQMCKFRDVFCAIAGTYYDQWERACCLRSEANPCTATKLLQEWAALLIPQPCSDLPDDKVELRRLLCDLLAANGVLTCDLIEREVTAAGYTFVRCEQDKEYDEDVVVTSSCGFSLGWSRPGVGGQVFLDDGDVLPAPDGAVVRTFEQRRLRSRQLQCLDCGDVPNVSEPEILCDPSCDGSAQGACSGATCDARLGTFYQTQSTRRLKRPFTWNVYVDVPDSECLQPQPGGLISAAGRVGHRFPCDLELDLCLVKALTPAHATVRYILECP